LPAGVAISGEALTLLRIDGPSVSVDYRTAVLAQHLASFGAAEILPFPEAQSLWLALRDVLPLGSRNAVVWRLSVAPSRGPDVTAALQKRLAARYFYDWGGGLIWLAVAPDKGAGAAKIREALAEAAGPEGGHATLIRAPEEIRATVDVFQPLARPLMEITAGIKASFDPDHILNPGRMYAGI
jgi:glycolate oxidase FAD binding subunit